MRNPMPTRYLSCAETAKLLRKALKDAFPGVKFSVRSDTYAGGASIRVAWLDGPTEAQVQAVTNLYEGRDFDGMIDLASSRRHWLTPQGEVFVAEIEGTEVGGGTIAHAEYIKPHDDAELVSFGSHYVFTRRNYSRAMMEKAAAWAEKTWGVRPEIREYQYKDGPVSYSLHAETEPDRNRYPGNAWTVAEVAVREMRQQAGPRHKDRFA